MPLRKKYLVIFFILICLCSLYFSFRYIDNLPSKVIEYQGISLGNSKDEVYYALGVPDEVLFPPEWDSKLNGSWQKFATKDEIKRKPSQEKGFDSWQYNKKGYRVDIHFDSLTGKVKAIGCYVSPNNWTDIRACKVNGIGALDSEDRVIDILGKPYSSSIAGLTKELLYPNLNMKINFEQKSVYYIIVTHISNN